MTRLVFAIIVSLAVVPATQAAAQRNLAGDAQMKQYVAAMDARLQEMGIDVRRVDMRRDELGVTYAVAESGPAPRYALAVVLTCIEPLAKDASSVRARDVTKGRRLLTLSVDAEQLAAVPGWIIGDAESAGLEALVDEIMAACEAAAD